MTDTAEMTTSSVDEKVVDAQLQTLEDSPDQVTVTDSNGQAGLLGNQTGSLPGAVTTPKEEHPVAPAGPIVDSATEPPPDNNPPLASPSVQESTVPSSVEHRESDTEACPTEVTDTVDNEQDVKPEGSHKEECPLTLAEETQEATMMTDTVGNEQDVKPQENLEDECPPTLAEVTQEETMMTDDSNGKAVSSDSSNDVAQSNAMADEK
ncbi:hypothetical protein IWQ61_009234 [Dispira simplex]|nr:hypothetical protein IWQ61_009234 [Dispira simplex]